MNSIYTNDEYIDSRDLISEYEGLQDELNSLEEELSELTEELDDLLLEDDVNTDEVTDLENRIEALTDSISKLSDELENEWGFIEEGASYASDWSYGETLIREDCFTSYIVQLIDDCYEIPQGWPMNHLDYEAAAEEAKQDYTELDINGITYLIRLC